jgi:hypothetical protein
MLLDVVDRTRPFPRFWEMGNSRITCSDAEGARATTHGSSSGGSQKYVKTSLRLRPSPFLHEQATADVSGAADTPYERSASAPSESAARHYEIDAGVQKIRQGQSCCSMVGTVPQLVLSRFFAK